MNPVLHEGVRHAQYGWVSGVMTILFIGVFLYWTYYAFARKNRTQFEEAAQLPLTDGDDNE